MGAALLAAGVLSTGIAANPQGKVATTTALALTTSAGSTSSVPVGTVVTLTATVTPASGKIAGQVNFCDAAATYCTDIHILGAAQVTSAGTAVLKLRPGVGSHSYKAVFAGTKALSSSGSGVDTITVTGLLQTVTTIAQTGVPGDYSLSASVIGSAKNTIGPTGNLSFVDRSTNNSVLATANLGDPSLLTLVNAFSPQVGNEPFGHLVSGDFNGDGNLDLAIGINSSTQAVTIALGDGTGNFTPVTNNVITGTGTPMLAADFNGDGKIDLLLSSNPGGAMRVLLGNGDGTFTEASGSPFYTNYGTAPVVSGDFNGDGIPDLAVAGGYYLVILLGNGDGTFTTVPIGSTSISESALFTSMVAADLNGDGLTDLVIADGGPGTIDIYLSNGDGTFTRASGTPPNLNGATQVALGDFNGDGKLDAALASYGGNDKVGIFLGNGDGSFQAPTTVTATIGGSPFVVSVGDFNADGVADLFLGAQVSGTTIAVLLGNGNGTFTQASTSSVGLPCCSTATFGDFNGDGGTDVASSSFYDGTVTVLLSNMRVAAATVNSVATGGPGDQQVVANYAGDQNYLPSISVPITLTSKVANPVLSLARGTYTSVQTLTISEATPGATIYYAVSGNNSTNGFVTYSGPITLSSSGFYQIQVYAAETGFLSSDTLIVDYTLVLPDTATPTISLAPGFYSGPQTATISDTDSTARIYYTTDGTYPDTNSNLYSGAITVSSSETLVARAISAGHSYSLPATAQYVIGGSSAAMIYSIAGSGQYGYSGDGGPATLAQLAGPDAVVKDGQGNLYFSDTGNHMVRKLSAGTGVISVLAGTGYNGYSGDGGQATNAALSYPMSLALDNTGNLFIADSGNSVVRELNLSSGIIKTYAGNPNATTQGDGGPATAASLGYIYGIALDPMQNLYIASYTTIRQVNNSTGIITTVAGTGMVGYSGEGGAASNAVFYGIYGLAFDAGGNLYVADSGNAIVRKIAAPYGVVTPSSIVTTVAGTVPQSGRINVGYSGDGGPATSAKLNDPVAVALDNSGNLFISDSYNSAIREVTASNGVINTVAGNGACAMLSGDGGAAKSASLCYQQGIAVDGAGNIYVADQVDRIREVVPASAPPTAQAATPILSLAAGTYPSPQSVTISDTTPGASIYVTVDGSTPTTGGGFGYSLPINVRGVITIKAIATAPGYLTSSVASATYAVSAFAPVITTVAGTGTQGFYGAGGSAQNMMFTSPKGVAVDKAGNLYVSDPPNNVVWMISAATGTASIYAGTGIQGYNGDGGAAMNASLWFPQGLAFDSAGNLYIADTTNNVIRKVTASTGIISTVAGKQNPTYGSPGDGGPATSANLIGPATIAFDKAGNLYIADSNEYRVREVSATTGIITTVAGNGTSTASGDGGPATSAGLQPPDSLAIDQAGNIYVASTYGARVRKITASTGQIDTIAGFKDLSGDTGDGGAATNAEISPRALAVDANGNLYISNRGDIREISASTGTISKVAGIGYPGYSGDGGAAAVAEIFYPNQVAFDAAGNLYYADSMARIRKVTFSELTTATPVFSVPAGLYTTAQTVAITDATPGATIYYTTDGSTPSTSSPVYTSAVTVATSQTINAMAVAVDYNQSSMASATYVISPPPPAAPSVSSLSPAYTSAAGPQFTLTVNGVGFTNASTVYWGTSGLTTQYVSGTQLTAAVPASDIASAGIISITVQTPAPGGGTSNLFKFEVDTAGSTNPPSFSPSSASTTAGGTASYPVTLPSSATSVSAQCLNLPAGASCSYSSSTGALTIATTTATPTGTFVITVVFTETLPGAAVALILLPFLLPIFARNKRMNRRQIWLLAIVTLSLAVGVAVGCGGSNGSGGGNNPPPQTHQVTSSGTVTLTVK